VTRSTLKNKNHFNQKNLKEFHPQTALNDNLYKSIFQHTLMTFKINIGEKSGKTYKLESDVPSLIDKELGDKINGETIQEDLKGYEFEITGASDKAGFPSMKEVSGQILKKVLLTYGKGMRKKPRKEGKKAPKDRKPKGLRLRKTVRGKVISEAIVQVNLKVIKEGKKPLAEIFNSSEKPSENPTQ